MRPLYESVKEDKSKADAMFEDLGYHKGYNIDKDGNKWGEYFFDKYYQCISFSYKDKAVCCYVKGSSDEALYINMQELKAINQKCKELKWI